jgi:hypothetical protein
VIKLKKTDEALACELFWGVFEFRQKKGLAPIAVLRLLKRHSQEDMRSGLPLSQGFRDGLADLIQGRRRGQPATWYRDTHVVIFINNCRAAGDSVATAKQKAEDNFGLGDETINRIWKRRRRGFLRSG